MKFRMVRTVVFALSLLASFAGACNDDGDRRVRDHDDRRGYRRDDRPRDRDRDDDDDGDDDRRRNRRDWDDDRDDDDDDDRRGYVQPAQQPVIVQQQQQPYVEEQPTYVQQQQPVYVDEEPVYVDEPRVVVVRQAPPPVIVETVPVCPHPGWVWRPGYYRPVGSRFVWIRGSYCAPRHGYVYSQPRYVRSGRGFEFHAAAWKRKR